MALRIAWLTAALARGLLPVQTVRLRICVKEGTYKDIRVRDDCCQRLARDTDSERFRRAEFTFASTDCPAPHALKDAVGDRRVDGEYETGLEPCPERSDASVPDNVFTRLDQRWRLAWVKLLARRDDCDWDGEYLSETSCERS